MSTRHIYGIAFQYEGKKRCVAISGSFSIERPHNWKDIEKEAKEEASVKLREFFSEIFPDEVVRILRPPEHIEVISLGVYK